MEASELQKINAQNKELESKLTNKNAEYFLKLNRQLEQAGLSEIQRVEKLNGLLIETVENQKSGITARQLFGTVSAQADILSGKRAESLSSGPEENTNPFLMWADNSLLLLGVLGLISGVMGITTGGGRSMYGIITTFVMALVGGLFFYMMYRQIYQYDRPEADTSKRPGMVKTVGLLALAMVAWFLSFGVTLLISPSINIYPEGWVMLVIGVLAIAARLFLKKRFNIRTSMASRGALEAEAAKKNKQKK